jgi:hypothetical protein
MSKAGPTIGQPLTSWDRLAPSLRKDGVIESDLGAARRAHLARRMRQAAAAIVLVVGGAAAGRLTAPANTPDVISTIDPTFTSVEQAQAAAASSQSIYQASLAYLAEQDTVGMSVATPAVIKARLAALEQVSQIAGAAVENAPYDPVVNNLYLNAQGQRAASMRILNTASTRLTTY